MDKSLTPVHEYCVLHNAPKPASVSKKCCNEFAKNRVPTLLMTKKIQDFPGLP